MLVDKPAAMGTGPVRLSVYLSPYVAISAHDELDSEAAAMQCVVAWQRHTHGSLTFMNFDYIDN